MYNYVLLICLIIIMFIVLDVVFFTTTTSLDEHLFHRNYYDRVDFPVESFITVTPSYTEKVKLGKQVAKTKTAVICCLARNVSHALPLAKSRIQTLGEQFEDYRVVIFENDSSDSTRSDLIDWKRANDRVHVIACGLDVDEKMDCKLNEKRLYDVGFLSQERMNKMSAFRNMYLQYVKNNFSTFDFMIVYDIDIVGPMNIDGLLTSFSSVNEWDVMCANGITPLPGTCGVVYNHYDPLAIIDLDDAYDELRNAGMLKMVQHHAKIMFDRRFFGEKLIPFKSAFGGCTMYKISSLLHDDVYYAPNYKCEHVYLHKKLADHGYTRLFVNPYAIILTGRQGPNLQKMLI